MLTRRALLKGLGAAGVLTCFPWIWTPRKSIAQTQAVSRAFIGAEGFGALANGWRNPNAKILFVTNLNDSGPGSFRQAYQVEKGPRYIIFQVGGYIPQRTTLDNLGNGYVYVAGQTAPGDGITLKGETATPGHYDGLYLRAEQICVRHLRVRCHGASDNSWACGIWGASHAIVDHCSFCWATDDQVMMQTAAGNITVQRCIISEARFATVTFAYNHGACSLHHNFMASGHQRNPLGGYGLPSQIINNLFYNWGGYAGRGTELHNLTGASPMPQFDVIGNYYKWGFGSGSENSGGWDNPLYGTEIKTHYGPGALYARSNAALLPDARGGYIAARHVNSGFTIMGAPMAAPAAPVTVDPNGSRAVADAWAAALLNNVGCIKPKRDAYDQFLVNGYTAFTGWKSTGHLTEFDSPFTIANGGNPWPALASGAAKHLQPSGMTDEFIARMGLANTAGSALSTSISQARGLGETYQNIEWCLMEQAGDIPKLNGGGDTTAPEAPTNLRIV